MFIIIFLLILTTLVLIHEAGHYFTAKWFKIKVEEFAVGFPLTKPLFTKKKGETNYSIYPALIGGFVKLYGEDEAGSGSVKITKEVKEYKDINRAFFARPVSQRAIVVVAGVVMNVILAAVIYYTYLGLTGFKAELPAIINHHFIGATQSNRLDGLVVDNVSPNSPAAKAGLKKATKDYVANIIALNGKKITSSQGFQNDIKQNRGKTISITYENALTKQKKTVTLIPRLNPPNGEGSLGIEFGIFETVVLNYTTPAEKILSGFTHPYNLMAYQFDILKEMIHTAIKTHNATQLSSAVSGPIGIAKLFQQIGEIPAWKERLLQYLNVAGLLSVSLAFFNVLPIPGLDGGRLFFILIEGITRRKIDPKIEGYIHTAGMAVLLGLLVLITFKDIFVH